MLRRWTLGRRPSVDPSTAIFTSIRWKLTAWYTGVLGATLLVMGVVLYLGEQQSLLGPVDNGLRTAAQNLQLYWQSDPSDTCQRADPSITGGALFWACFDARGRLAGQNPFTSTVPSFLDVSAARGAIHNGSATDTVDSETALKSLRIYALRFTTVAGTTGVIEVGTPVGDRVQALQQLLFLLIVCGSLGLLFAAVSGIFLAARSLAPVRLAYVRQRDFVANASHELRTPLTMVRADAEVLLRDRGHLNEDQAALLEDVVLEASHMAALANKMLDLARLDAGQLHLEQEVIDLTSLARDIARRAEALAREQDVQLRVADGNAVLVVGDPILLEHLVMILVDNAIKYNRPRGEVFLSTRATDDEAVLEVRDTGIGIDAEHLPHLGERFYRIDKARSREAGGAGLGLSIVRGVADMHKGTFQIESEPGGGTTAVLRLPLLKSNVVSPDETARPTAERAS
ncbi:MAG TPA: histidine kinase [Chloroflexi bacterium]|nr:histidine kinase [Chloroflexota bacterium]